MILPLLALAIQAAAAPVGEAVLFQETFQSGDAKGWRGTGGARLSTYEGNVSMKLNGGDVTQLSMRTAGEPLVKINAALAAESLEGDDACVVEATGDGRKWLEILTVRDGRDNAVTLWRASAGVEAPDGVVQVRARAQGDSQDTCWLDDVVVSSVAKRPATGARSAFSAADLAAGAKPAAPVHASAYAPATGAQAAGEPFSGRLTFDPKAGSGFKLLKDIYDQYTSAAAYLPPFEAELVQAGDALVPIRRGLILTEHPRWDYILEPGRVWREAADGNWTRAALPFSLQEKNANCTHSGMLTFLFRGDGLVSNVAWQIGSETCAYFKFDAWGMARAQYRPGGVENAAEVAAAYRAEVARRLPRKPIADLAALRPDVDVYRLAGEIAPWDVTTYGLVYEGVHYSGGCDTRYGQNPYCEVLDLPSYSFAKTIAGGFALMRLELLEPGASRALISEYVPECGGPAWRGVTFEHALDMATGNYVSPDDEVDEDGPLMDAFLSGRTHADRLSKACGTFPRKAEPGTHWVYHTSDTYVLGAALRNYLKRRDPSADSYEDLVVDPLWKPLGLSPVSHTTRRSMDEAAQPFTGWGLTFLPDDYARIGLFLHGGGVIGGQQAVARQPLLAGLQRDPADRGLQAISPAFKYQNGFWARDVGSMLGCSGSVWVPYMSGYGGLSLVVMPNGIIAYAVGDNYDYGWSGAARVAHQLNSMCG